MFGTINEEVDKMDIFCKIINNEIPSLTVYEDDVVKAFLDVNPDVNGHLLVVPKKHILDIYDMDDDTLTHIFKIAKEMGQLLNEKLHSQGVTFVQNNGDVQEVKHFHLHVKPYYSSKQELVDVKDVYEQLMN